MRVPEYAILSYDTAGGEGGGLSTRCTKTRGGGGGALLDVLL